MTVGLLSFGVAPSLFNGGKTQANFDFVGGNTEFAFADATKTGSEIVSGGVLVPPSNRDANGYPLTGTWSKPLFMPKFEQKSGDWLMMWKGGGPNTVMLSPGGTFVSGSLNGANGTYRFKATAGLINALFQPNVGVSVTGASYSQVTQLSVVNVSDLAAWQADPNALTQEFIAAFAAGRYGVCRFLNWSGDAFHGGNESMVTDWASRKGTGYHTFRGAEYRANWWAGTPTNGGTSGLDYTLTTPASPGYIFGNGTPVDKQIMHVQFADTATAITSSAVNLSTPGTVGWSGHPFVGGEPVGFSKTSSNPANLPASLWPSQTYYVLASGLVAGVSFQISLTPGGAALLSFGSGASGSYFGARLATLNVNGEGAIPIRNIWGDPLGATQVPKSLDASSNPIYGTLIRDVDLGWLKFGGDAADGSQGVQNGVPPETQLATAIKLGAHPWFVAMPFSLDPMTDFEKSKYAYVKANAPSWMVPRFETPNEQWNSAAGFWNVRYAWNKAFLHWALGFGHNAWQGKIASTMGQDVVSVYGTPDGTKFHLVDGMPWGFSYSTNGAGPIASSNSDRLSSTTYVNQVAAAQAGYAKTAASKYTTLISAANYYGPGASGKLAEVQLAIDYYSVNFNNPTAQAAGLNSYIDTVHGPSISGTGILVSGSPGVLHWPAHGFSAGQGIILYTSGNLFTGLSPRVLYYASIVDADNLQLATTSGGTSINFTGSQSGIQTAVAETMSGAPDITMMVAGLQAYYTWCSTFTNDAGITIGLQPYEGNLSPFPDTGNSSASVTSPGIVSLGAGQGTTLTLGTNTTLPNGTSVAGVAARVGGSISLTGALGMTQINTPALSGSVVFAGGGSANITVTGNSLIVGQTLAIAPVNNLFQVPPEVTDSAIYYVVSAGNTFQISATLGGTPITFATATTNTLGGSLTIQPGWPVTAVSGQTVTLGVDSSAFSAWTSGGTVTYTNSGRQVGNFKVASRTATNLRGYIYGNTTPIPSMISSMLAIGATYPSKFQFGGGFANIWGALNPTIFPPYPTTGEWQGMIDYSNS